MFKNTPILLTIEVVNTELLSGKIERFKTKKRGLNPLKKYD
jgi:hypothetical protein